jgi:hypothetical protein
MMGFLGGMNALRRHPLQVMPAQELGGGGWGDGQAVLAVAFLFGAAAARRMVSNAAVAGGQSASVTPASRRIGVSTGLLRRDQ